MLSIVECRRYLKDCAYPTKKIEEIRDYLYQLANMLVNDYLSASGKEKAKLRMVVNERK